RPENRTSGMNQTSTGESENQRSVIRELVFEALLAIATLTLWPLLDDRESGTVEERGRALMFTPVIGLALGVTLTLIDRSLSSILGLGVRSLIVMILASIAMLAHPWRGLGDTVDALRFGLRSAPTGLSRMGPLGALMALLGFVSEVTLLARISDPSGRACALILATMLARWSIVAVGYGLKPIERWGLGVPYEGGI